MYWSNRAHKATYSMVDESWQGFFCLVGGRGKNNYFSLLGYWCKNPMGSKSDKQKKTEWAYDRLICLLPSLIIQEMYTGYLFRRWQRGWLYSVRNWLPANTRLTNPDYRQNNRSWLFCNYFCISPGDKKSLPGKRCVFYRTCSINGQRS